MPLSINLINAVQQSPIRSAKQMAKDTMRADLSAKIIMISNSLPKLRDIIYKLINFFIHWLKDDSYAKLPKSDIKFFYYQR